VTAREPKPAVLVTAGPCGGIKNMPAPRTALGKLLARIPDSKDRGPAGRPRGRRLTSGRQPGGRRGQR
jgi:hypothetical protein